MRYASRALRFRPDKRRGHASLIESLSRSEWFVHFKSMPRDLYGSIAVPQGSEESRCVAPDTREEIEIPSISQQDFQGSVGCIPLKYNATVLSQKRHLEYVAHHVFSVDHFIVTKTSRDPTPLHDTVPRMHLERTREANPSHRLALQNPRSVQWEFIDSRPAQPYQH